MATQVLTAARVEVNGVNLSPWVRSAELSIERDVPEQTTMGDTTRRVIGGLLNWNLSVTFAQTFAGAAVDATIWAAFAAGAAVVVRVRPTQAVISATNPEYHGSAVISSYNPVAGGVGDLHETTAEFVAAGALTRAVA